MENGKFNSFKWFMITGFFSGLLPKAPGTWGSVVGVIIAYLTILFIPNPYPTIWLLIAFFTIVGFKFINEYEEITNIHDDKRIVIDEIVGVLITIGLIGNLQKDTLIQLILAFVAFRILDIKKPSVIGKIDEKAPKALGVMGDDIVAGFFAAVLAGIIYVGWLKIF